MFFFSIRLESHSPIELRCHEPTPPRGLLSVLIELQEVAPPGDQPSAELLLVEGLAHAERVVVQQAAVHKELELGVVDGTAGLEIIKCFKLDYQVVVTYLCPVVEECSRTDA